MRNLFVIMKYTIKENIRKKIFKVTNIIMLSVIVILFNIPNIIGLFSDAKTSNVEEKEVITVVDKSNIFNNALSDLSIPNTVYTFNTDNEKNLKDLKKDLEGSKFKAILEITESDNTINTNYTFRKEDRYYNVTALNNILKSIHTNILLSESSVSEDIVLKINTPFNYSVIGLDSKEESGLGFTLSIIFSLFLYMSIYFYGYSVSSSISSEKTSRVMETLVTSTKPSSIVLGKTLGMGILGFFQISMVFVASYLSYNLFLPKDYNLFGEVIDLSMFDLPTVSLILLYFILGYSIYAMMSAVTGATVSKAEDLSAASMPVSMISLISFYLGYFSLLNAGSKVNTFASIFPLSSAFTMPSRIIMGSASALEITSSILLLVLSIYILGWVSIRVYSAAILHYGQRLTLKDLIQIYKND